MSEYRGKKIFIGKTRQARRDVHLDPSRLVMHTLVVGGTGSGKSVYLEGFARQAIRNREPLIVLDPKGSLYDRLVEYCYHRNRTDNLYLIDPNDDRYRVGLNYFDLGSFSTAKKVGMVKEAIYRVMGQGKEELTITFERWGSVALSLLDQAKLTLAEFHTLLVDEDFRNAVLPFANQDYTQQEWAHFYSTSARQQEANLLASINRSSLFMKEPALYEMIGQQNAIDWQKVMNEGGVVLVNLAPRKVTNDLVRFLGIMLVHQIYHAALCRPKEHWRTPCYVLADEFAKVISGDFKDSLQECREFGVGFTLALQNIEDLKGVDPNNPEAMLTSVFQNTETKLAFKTRYDKEAMLLARNLFAPQITARETKGSHTSAVPRPYEKEVEVHTSSSGDSDGHGQSMSFTTALAGTGVYVQSSTSQGTTHSDTASSSSSESVSRSTQQWVDFDYEEIPEYQTLEETLHRYATRLMRQKPGEAQLQFDTNFPVMAIKTELPSEPRVRVNKQKLLEFTAKVFERMGALSPVQARELIEERKQRLLYPSTQADGGLLPEHRIEPEIEAGEDDPATKD